MENIVQLKDAQPVVRIMANVVLAMKDYGSVDATMDGTVLIVPLRLNSTVTIIRIMTKVRIVRSKKKSK